MHCSLPLARKIYGIISVLFPIVLFVFLNVIAHSTGKTLSFEVLSVLPPSSSGGFPSRKPHGLRDDTPLTVVFSLPVIRLGEQLQLNPTPFELLECAGGGKKFPIEKLGRFRWVSTSIVRFDPINWPPDLCFKLVIKSTLKTYDGIPLTKSYSADYHTLPLSMYVRAVRSKMALAATGGRWKSYPCPLDTNLGCDECPMDGIVLIHFSHPVVPSRVLAALTLNKGAGLHDWVGSCSGSQEEKQTNTTDVDTPVYCFAVRPRNLRSYGVIHKLKLPRSSRVSPMGGGTQKELTVFLTGAVPFKFQFRQETMPNIITTPARESYREYRPRFRRYKLYLHHGLRILVAAANANQDLSLVDLSPLKDSMDLIDLQTNRSMDFTLQARDLTTLIFSAALNPSQKYMIKAAAANNVLDGFGMPLRSSSTTFRTADAPSFFANPSASIAVFSSTSVSSGVLDTWPVVAHGKKVVNQDNRAADMHCTPITESNFASIMVVRMFRSSARTTDLEKIWASAVTQSVSLPMTDELSVVGCPDVSGLLQGSLTSSKYSGMFYVIKRGSWFHSLAQQIIVVTDLSVVFVPSYNGHNQVTAWVTDSTGADVAGALVRLFSMPSISYYDMNVDDVKVVLVGTSTTGADGLASVQFALKNHEQSKLVALVTHADTGGVAFEPQVPMPVRLTPVQWQGRIHTDRGLYKPGDDVHVKVVVRSRLGGFAGKNSGRLRVPTEFNFFLRVRWSSQHQPLYEAVTLSEAFGTASLKLTVPMDADMGSVNLHLARRDALNEYDLISDGEKILIADPRPPTVTMDLSLHSTVDANKRTGLLVVPPGAKARVDVRVVTKTQTGAFVENAKVVVAWTLVRGKGALEPGDDAQFKPKPRSSVYGLDTSLFDIITRSTPSMSGKDNTSGEFTIVTALGGVGRMRFDLASALREELQAPAQTGDLLEVSAQWVGPTREVVRNKKSVPVADSPYAVGVALSISDPLPGIHFGVRVDVRVAPDAVIQASAVSTGTIESGEYTLSLYKWTQTTSKAFTAASTLDDTSLQDSLLKFLSTPRNETARVSHTCKSLKNDGGATTQCDGQVHLPTIGEYLLVMQNKAAVGAERVVAALVLGRSLASWQAKPLSALASGLGVIADRPQYSEGDVATLTFVSPFAGTASLLVTWGNYVSGQASGQKKLRLRGAGKHTFTVELGAECRCGCLVHTIVTAPAQSASVELPVVVPLSKLLQTKVPRTVIMRTTLAVRDLDVPTHQPKVTISFPGQGGRSEFVLSPGKTANLLVNVDMTAYSGANAELMIYATDQAFLDLEPHPLPALAPSFTMKVAHSRHLTDTRRFSASAVGFQSSITTFKRRFAADPWICPDSLPLRPDEAKGWRDPSFRIGCGQYRVTNKIAEVDETDAVYFGRHDTELTHFPEPSYSYSEMNDKEGPPSSSSRPSALTTSGTKLRTNTETTPLFVGSVKLTAKGRATVAFTVPENIGRFAVRAVVVGNKAAPGLFAETETHVIVRKALSLLPSQPRIVRSRDTFNCGVTVTLQRAKFDGVLNVLARIRSQDDSQQQPLLYFAGDNATHSYAIQSVTGSGPHEILFPFVARDSAIGSTQVEFYAQAVSQGVPPVTDALQTRIIVGPVSDPVMLATSVSITAAAEAVIWSEGITLPKAIPGTGSIVLRAGAGHLPAVLQCASALNSDRETNWRDGEAIVSALAAPAALGEYYLTAQARKAAWGDGGAGHIAAEGLKLAVPALQRFTHYQRYTDDSRGLFWRQSVQGSTANVRLNAKGAFFAGAVLKRLKTDVGLKQTIGGQSVVAKITALQNQWIDATWRGLKQGVRSCPPQTRYCWTDCDALAAARLVLPLESNFLNYKRYGTTFDFSEATLYAPDYIKLCSVGGQADAALVQLVRHAKKAKASTKAKAILTKLIQRLRVQGQAAYITASAQSTYPASWEAQAKALLALSHANSGLSDHPLLPKLAAWVSSGGGRPGFVPPALAFASLALARYDAAHGNTNVDAWLIARTGGQVLLDGAWDNPSDLVVRTETLWDALSVTSKPFGRVPEPLVFRVQGRGEVSLSAQLRYIPVDAPGVGGIFQGISVEKVIEMADMSSGDRIPGAVSIVGVGDLVLVTIQVSTPDMLGAVTVSDLLPGGLEPVDPNVGDGAGLIPTSWCSFSQQNTYAQFQWCWDPFSSGRETRPDRVDWFAHQLWPGTHTIRYHARAVTSGIFQVPGTAARAMDKPEIMGVSAGGKFVVSATPVSHLTTAQKSDLLRQKYSIGPAIVKKCGDSVCAAQNAVCDGVVGKCVCLDGSAMLNGKCTVLPLLPPSYHKSIPFNITLGIKSKDASAERWNQHRGAIRKSMARTLLLNFNVNSPDDCPFLSLGEHDVTINKVDQKDTSSAVVHASVAFWGPTGNVVATRCSESMKKSITTVIANGHLARSVKEAATLRGVPHVTMRYALEDTTASAITTTTTGVSTTKAVTTASPSTTSNAAVCKQWCAANKISWKKKCTWPGSCDGCSDCLVSTSKTVTSVSPSTNSNTAVCNQWCAAHKQPWKKKCTWTGLCNGCSDCLVPITKTVTTASPSTKSNAAVCKQWCAANKLPWNKKCTWAGSCNGCSDCLVLTTKTVTTASPSTNSNAAVCNQWCAANKLPWKKKCTWAGSCNGCSDCLVSTTNAVTTASPTTKSNAAVCNQWCAANKLPWKKKCTWTGSCDGCSDCLAPHVVSTTKTVTTASPSTKSNAAVCKQWCASNKLTWKNKCTWTGSCDGCPDCLVSTTKTVTTASPSTKSNAAVCKQWCATIKQAWKNKCTWLGSCDGCSDCLDSKEAKTQERSVEVSKVNKCKKKSLIGSRGCEHQQPQSSKKSVEPITNLSSHTRVGEFMFMFVCLLSDLVV